MHRQATSPAKLLVFNVTLHVSFPVLGTRGQSLQKFFCCSTGRSDVIGAVPQEFIFCFLEILLVGFAQGCTDTMNTLVSSGGGGGGGMRVCV